MDAEQAATDLDSEQTLTELLVERDRWRLELQRAEAGKAALPDSLADLSQRCETDARVDPIRAPSIWNHWNEGVHSSLGWHVFLVVDASMVIATCFSLMMGQWLAAIASCSLRCTAHGAVNLSYAWLRMNVSNEQNSECSNTVNIAAGNVILVTSLFALLSA